MNLQELEKQTRAIVIDIVEHSAIKEGQIFVPGLSSGEVAGGLIGKNSSARIGEVIVKTILEVLKERGIYLAVQGCEHLSRALTIEHELVEKKELEIVNVIPDLHAGGSGQVVTFKFMQDPIEVGEIVAHAGLDIGDTSVGMHVRRVQVPLIPAQRELGGAHVTALTSRLKLIDGARAAYTSDPVRKF